MKNFIETNCEFCSEPIFEDVGRKRIGGKDYHDDDLSDCYKEHLLHLAEKPEVIDVCAESMLFDKRITA